MPLPTFSAQHFWEVFEGAVFAPAEGVQKAEIKSFGGSGVGLRFEVQGEPGSLLIELQKFPQMWHRTSFHPTLITIVIPSIPANPEFPLTLTVEHAERPALIDGAACNAHVYWCNDLAIAALDVGDIGVTVTAHRQALEELSLRRLSQEEFAEIAGRYNERHSRREPSE